MITLNRYLLISAALIALLLVGFAPQPAPLRQVNNPDQPNEVVKLIFIHHSTGENWLKDSYGDLGRTLDANNYFVSDTNYGWGPNAIGDRTDIPNWTEWFTSENTPTYMDALFRENGQHSDYTRTLSDPGGENAIVMFKSCFPNSALEGKPNDPPGTYEDLTVSGAKYVYNRILQYFATRPDKLFVVITAPPLSDTTYAENARAFNNWLLNDWLRENNYTQNNVAIFDFYNVLTSPDAHHRYDNGQLEHILTASNTLYYPSDDDHPSVAGSQKATEEFVPLLNIFYHRWQENAPLQPPPAPVPTTETGSQPDPPVAHPSTLLGVIDDFEGAPPSGTSDWEGYFQDNTDTQLTCARDTQTAHNGTASLQFKFEMAANSWATCGFYLDDTQDWSTGQGISFYLRGDRVNIPFDINLYGGSPAAHTTYVFHTQTPPGSESNWMPVEIHWADILRTEWEENPGTPFDPTAVTGFSIGLSTPETERYNGTIWLDDLSLLGAPVVENTTPSAVGTSIPQSPSQPEQPAQSRRPFLPCGGALVLPLLLTLPMWKRLKRRI